MFCCFLKKKEEGWVSKCFLFVGTVDEATVHCLVFGQLCKFICMGIDCTLYHQGNGKILSASFSNPLQKHAHTQVVIFLFRTICSRDF